MSGGDLLKALKKGNSQEIRQFVRKKCSLSAETLLPFVLRKCLRKEHLALDDVRYVKNCFRVFSDLRCLNGEDQAKCAETHRTAFVTEATFIMEAEKNYLDAGRDVTAVFKEFVELYSDEKLAKQLTYFVLVCHRRSRFAEFKQNAPKMRGSQERRLRRKALPIVEDFISRM